MTVKELIERLQKYPQHLTVLMHPEADYDLEIKSVALGSELHPGDQEEASYCYLREVWEYEVTCKFCGDPCNGLTAHSHDRGWVGDDCCWDEHLRATE